MLFRSTVDETREGYMLEQFSTMFQERVTGAKVEYAGNVTLMEPKDYYAQYSKAE